MSDHDHPFNSAVRRVAQSIRYNRLAILAGAGIGVPSGLPLGNDIVRELVNSLRAKASQSGLDPSLELSKTDITTIRPEIAIDILRSTHTGSVPLGRLFSGFRHAVPTHIHYFIAQLLSSQRASRVITTNYDELIENAWADLFSARGSKREVPFVIQRARDLLPNSSRPHILKIHGSLKTNPILAVGQFPSLPREFADYFCETLSCFDLLVLGYSGRDDFSLHPLFVTTESSRSLFWIDHARPETHNILTLQFDAPASCVSLRDKDYLLRVPTPRITARISRRGSLLIRGDTSTFISMVSVHLGLHAITRSNSRPLDTLEGIRRWVETNMTPELAALCLIKLYRRVEKPAVVRPPAARVLRAKRFADRAASIRAQGYFEFAVLCKECGRHGLAQNYFQEARRAAISWYRSERQTRGRAPARIRELISDIQRMWGFSLKDQGTRKARQAERRFREQVKPFPRDGRVLAEVFWIMKDTGRLPDAIGLARDLLTLRSSDHGKIHDYLSWGLLDYARDLPLKDRWRYWDEGLEHIKCAVKLYELRRDFLREGRARRSWAMQRLHIMHQLSAADQDIKGNLQRFGGADVLAKAEEQLERADRLFIALEDLAQRVYVLAGKALAAYIGGRFSLGDSLLRALAVAAKTAPLTEWERKVWVPNEISHLRKIRTAMRRSIKNAARDERINRHAPAQRGSRA